MGKPGVPKAPTLPKNLPQKLPEFLSKRPGVGKITGRLDELKPAERRFVEELKDLGHDVEIIPRGAGKTPDFGINGVVHELKTVSTLKNTDPRRMAGSITNRISNARSQSANVNIDARAQVGMTEEIAADSIRRAFTADTRRKISTVTVMTKSGAVHVVRSK
ncbi:MAG: hypothetical protein HOP09_08580 [Hyphomicrobium sp.]|nr:hypothetical protein [Hyphomicrobium sp.]